MRNGNEIINLCIIEFFLLLLEPRSLIALKIFYSGLQLKLWQHSHVKREVSMFGLFWFGTDQFTDLRSLIKLSLWNFQKSLFRVFTYRVLAIMPKRLIFLLHAFTDTLIIYSNYQITQGLFSKNYQKNCQKKFYLVALI